MEAVFAAPSKTQSADVIVVLVPSFTEAVSDVWIFAFASASHSMASGAVESNSVFAGAVAATGLVNFTAMGAVSVPSNFGTSAPAALIFTLSPPSNKRAEPPTAL